MSLNSDLVLKASNALLNHVKNKQEEEAGSNLFAEEKQAVQLIVGVKKFAGKARHKPYRIPLSAPLYDESAEVCLFTKIGDKAHREKLMSLGIPQLKEVISIYQLKHDYKSYEVRRQLLGSYDLFLADDRIIRSLPEALGVKFFAKKKLPSPVDIAAGNIKKEITKAISCTYFTPTKGTCAAIKIGTTEMTPKQLAENIETAVSAIVERIPKKWENVQSLSIKTGDSLSLPIYNSLPDNAEAIASKDDEPSKEAEAKPKKTKRPASDEASAATKEEAPQQKKSKKSPLSREKPVKGAAVPAAPAAAKKGGAKKQKTKA
ncbi:proteasome-interacting protein cic1 [Dipsacomyces acuminosporus]|nr:proteasome-interacting protein cic1 [Dipsacomyces acuminosporus]